MRERASCRGKAIESEYNKSTGYLLKNHERNGEAKEKPKGSIYADNFAFLLRCRKCGGVIRELGGDAYTAEQALLAVRASDETCPFCGKADFGKLRRISADHTAE